jgi:ABC-type bacteriocin/lantibiotic exporter with double-glycine peptidase domain
VTSTLASPKPVCGANSLYLFLRLHGCNLSYSELAAALGEDERGVSLHQLRSVASAFDLQCTVRKGNLINLGGCSLPLIAHMANPTPGELGHYVVVVHLSDAAVTMLDGTSGLEEQIPLDEFARSWTGYVLEGGAGSRWALELEHLASLLLASFVWFALYVAIRRRVARTVSYAPFCAIVAVGLCLIPCEVIGASPPSNSSNDPSGELWRNSRFDAVNSLFLFLRAHDRRASYETLLESLPKDPSGNSLVHLRDAARQCGLATHVVRMGPDSLTRCRLPVIVVLDSPIDDRSRFALLVSAGRETHVIIETSEVVFRKMRSDEFRRYWSGYALVAQPDIPWVSWSVCALSAAILITYACLRRWRTGASTTPMLTQPTT